MCLRNDSSFLQVGTLLLACRSLLLSAAKCVHAAKHANPANGVVYFNFHLSVRSSYLNTLAVR